MKVTNGYTSLSKIPADRLNQDKVLQLLETGRGALKLWEFRAGYKPPTSLHPEEQISYVISGKVEFKIGDGMVQICGPGDIVVVPGNVPHEGHFVEETRMLSIFMPAAP